MNPRAQSARVRGVLFDLDGTLIDSAPDLAGAANDLRHAHGLPPLPYASLRPMVGSGARGMVGVAFGVAPGDARFEALRDAFLARYEQRLLQETVVFAAMVPVLAALTFTSEEEAFREEATPRDESVAAVVAGTSQDEDRAIRSEASGHLRDRLSSGFHEGHAGDASRDRESVGSGHLRGGQLGRGTWDGLGLQRVHAARVVGREPPVDRPPVEPQAGSHELGTFARFNPLHGAPPHLLQGLMG